MPSILTLLAGGLALAAIVSADPLDRIFNRAAKYTTVTVTTTITTTGPVAYIVNSAIGDAGPQTFIPGALTVTFTDLPAYIYMETFTTGSTVITSTYKTRIPVSAAQQTIATSQASIATSAAQPSSSTPGTPTIITTNTATCCSLTDATYTTDSFCDGLPDGTHCGSTRGCFHGGCYSFGKDYMCGDVNIACNTAGGYHCIVGRCEDTLFDASNCGGAQELCGDNHGNKYACYLGVCVNISTDDNNCGALGSVCPTGTGCKAETCIDTTSDSENCSVVGYACPDGTTCINSLCQ